MQLTIYTKDSVPYTLEEPAALSDLMKKYPDLEKMIALTMAKSEVGFNKEHGFIAYEVDWVSEKLGTLFYQEFTDGNCCGVTMSTNFEMSFAKPVVNFHSHPFTPSHHTINGFFNFIGYGPSQLDLKASQDNPSVIYVAQDLEQRFYFGPRSK